MVYEEFEKVVSGHISAEQIKTDIQQSKQLRATDLQRRSQIKAGLASERRVNSYKNVTEAKLFTHLEMLPGQCRLLSVGCIGLRVFPELLHCCINLSA